MLTLTEKCPCCGSQFQKVSKCEMEVYPHTLRGLTIDQIGGLVFKAPKTVATYKYRMLQKFGLKTKGNRGRSASMLLLINHAHLCLARWTRGINAERLRNRGSWGKGWLDGYRMAMLHMIEPEIHQIQSIDEVRAQLREVSQ